MKKQLIVDGNLTNYYADEDGIIYNKTGKIIKVTERGTAQLRVGSKSKNCSVGKIIAENFIPNENAEDCLIKHFDGNRQNNSVENLYWITQQDNAANTWQKRRENGTTGAGEVRGPREKRENIVDLKELESKLNPEERVVVLEGEVLPYAISSSGKLRNLNTGHFLKGNETQGYLSYCLRYNNKQKNIFAHRLVALMFLKREDGKDVVDHIDGNRQNNHVSNLRWVSIVENANNLHYNTKYSRRGERNYSTSLKDLEGEEWKQYRDTPIMISNLGRVKNITSNRILKGSIRLDGYHEIGCSYFPTKILTHRLVWEVFCGEIEDSMVINHINGIKNDNRLENLEKVTFQENLKKASMEVNAWNFSRVGSFNDEGELIGIYANATEAANAVGILPSSMRNTIRRCGKCHDGLSYRYLDK